MLMLLKYTLSEHSCNGVESVNINCSVYLISQVHVSLCFSYYNGEKTIVKKQLMDAYTTNLGIFTRNDC